MQGAFLYLPETEIPRILFPEQSPIFRWGSTSPQLLAPVRWVRLRPQVQGLGSGPEVANQNIVFSGQSLVQRRECDLNQSGERVTRELWEPLEKTLTLLCSRWANPCGGEAEATAAVLSSQAVRKQHKDRWSSGDQAQNPKTEWDLSMGGIIQSWNGRTGKGRRN